MNDSLILFSYHSKVFLESHAQCYFSREIRVITKLWIISFAENVRLFNYDIIKTMNTINY